MSARLFTICAPLTAILLMDARIAGADAADPAVPPAGESTAVQLDVITVTAQRRTQAAQDVPIPVQVISEKQIESLASTDLSRMNGYIPGLVVDGTQPTQSFYALRGISISDFGIGTDSPIGVYEDGVYAGKTGGALLAFNDVQRIEVLKGPQGTLFGRNSAGGAISITTNAPVDNWEAGARMRFGNFGAHYIDGVLNAPLGEAVAARLTFVENYSQGWLRDNATGARYDRDGDWGLRAQLRWDAPADTRVRIAWEHEKLDQPARPAIGLVALPTAPGLPTFPPDPDTWLNPFSAPVLNDVVGGSEKRTFDGVTLRITHPFAIGDLTSISSYRHFSTLNREEQDGTNRAYLYFDDANVERNTSWSQELTLARKNSLADWVAGMSYYYDDARQTSQLNFLTDSLDTILNNLQVAPGGLYGPLSQLLAANGIPLSLLGDPWQENMINRGVFRAYALYGDVIWHLDSRWNLTTGVRFTHDQKEFSWYNPLRSAPQLDATLTQLQGLGFFDVPGVPPLATFQQNLEFNTPASAAAPLSVNNSWNDVSPRAVLDFKPVPDVMLYVSATRGYQAGGYNALLPGSHYQPETVRNYEAGIKSELADRRLLLNASVYYYLYSNLQSLSLVSNGNGALPLYLVTISDQHARGAELESHWQATDALRLNLATAYIDATYKHFVAPDGVDLSGQPTGEPSWSAAVALDYLWHGILGGDLDLTFQDAYRGPTRCNADSAVQGTCLRLPAFRVGEAQNRTDLRVAWEGHGRVPLELAAFVNNVFDERYVKGVSTISATTLGTPFTNVTAPRMWGVEAAVHF